MTYAAEEDPWCYPGTSVLRNKLNLRNQAELEEFELAFFLTRAEEPVPGGQLDYRHYKTLHHHLFQDMYEWAGEIRRIRIGKAGSWFCYPEYIDAEMQRLFERLKSDRHFVGLPHEALVKKSADFLADLNAIHPFREGNGRTQLAFLIMLIENAGGHFNHDALHPAVFFDAMIESFRGNEGILIDILDDLIV